MKSVIGGLSYKSDLLSLHRRADVRILAYWHHGCIYLGRRLRHILPQRKDWLSEDKRDTGGCE